MKSSLTPAAVNKALNEMAQEVSSTFWISKVLPLALVATEEFEMNDALEEFIEELDYRLIDDLASHFNLDGARQAIEEGEEDELIRELFIDAIRDQERFGFLCMVDVPEATRHGDTVSVRYGICRRRWFYDEELSGILQQADAWAKSLERPARPLDSGRASNTEGGR